MKCQSILVVEDNDDIRETLAEVLEFEGYCVESVQNGQEAIRRLEVESRNVLILLDLMMPVMNGWEFLDAQKLNPNLERHPVVILSAVSAIQNQEDLLALGTADLISKPIDLSRLFETVGQFCDRKTQHRSA